MSREKTFYGYFKENMEGLGLPAPDSLFGTLSTATASIATLIGAVETLGTEATIAEVVGAGTATEALMAVGGCLASFYVGACIGSLAVATGIKLSGGYNIYELFACAERNSIVMPIWLRNKMMMNPALNPALTGKRIAQQSQWQRYSRIG